MAKSKIDELVSIGIDVGKDTFHIVALAPDGQLVMHKQIKRIALEAMFTKLPRCIVGTESCLSAALLAGRFARWASNRVSSRRSM